MCKRAACALAAGIAVAVFSLPGWAAPRLPDAPVARPAAATNFQPPVRSAALPAAEPGHSTLSGLLPEADPLQERTLTRAQAESLAIRQNPRISAAHLLALAERQVVRETRSAELPEITGNLTAVQAEDESRISAGSLTSPHLFTHAGAGAGISQLITDFGRTGNLVAASRLREEAKEADAMATTEDVVAVTDQAFYGALEAQAQLRIARQDVLTRQMTEKQVKELTRNKLRSTLDLSFAEVNLSQAKLLELDAEDNAKASMAALDAVLGFDREVRFQLADPPAALAAAPADVERLIQLALTRRPDLRALSDRRESELKMRQAERAQLFPTISALATAGSGPVRPDQYAGGNWWGAAGANVRIPIFEGFQYRAQAKESAIRAQAAAQQERDLRDTIVRDVRTSWLQANTAFERVSVSAALLKQANLALTLAQTRYRLGLSSIVELSDAQLQQTSASMAGTKARYEYELALAVLNFETGQRP